MRSNARIKKALYQLLDEIYLYEDMLEKRFKYSNLKADELAALLEEIKYIENSYAFIKEQVGLSSKKPKVRLKLIDF